MGIWPHPDDEAYLSAGLMARMADAGRRVTVLTLTRGEKGTSDPADFDQPHFAARRERELRASLAELGVDDVRVLDYRDGECDLVDDEAAIAGITEQIDALRPDMVITFGPDGITGHRDHRIVSAWVTEAWRRVGHGELLYATMTDEFVSRTRRVSTNASACSPSAPTTDRRRTRPTRSPSPATSPTASSIASDAPSASTPAKPDPSRR